MLNLIRMNLLKVMKMKSLYVISVVAALFCVILVVDAVSEIKIDLDGTVTEQEQQTQEESNDPNALGLTVDTNTLPSVLDYECEFYRSGILALLLSIFAVIYACGERGCGFLKNLTVCAPKKWYIVVARMSSMLVFFLLESILTLTVMMITNALLGGYMAAGSVSAFLPAMFLQLLLHMALTAFVFAVVELSRNSMISMIVGIFISMGVGSVIVSGICDFIGKLTSRELPFAGWLICTRIKMTALPLDTVLIPGTLLVGTLTLLGYLVISSLLIEKRDFY